MNRFSLPFCVIILSVAGATGCAQSVPESSDGTTKKTGTTSSNQASGRDPVPDGSADSCSDVRLDQPGADGTPGSMESVPVPDQGPYGICYAEAATQLVDAYRFSVLKDPAVGRRSAVLSAAVGLNLELSQDPFGGGQICNATNYIRVNGYYDSLSVTKCILSHESKETVLALSGFYDAFWNEMNAFKKTQSAKLPADAFKDAYDAHYNSTLATTTQKIQDWLGTQGVASYLKPTQAVLKDLLTLRKLRFIWGVEGFQCFAASTPYRLTIPSCQHEKLITATPAERAARLSSLLDKMGGQPIGIDYCDPVLTVGKTYAGVGINNGTTQCAPVIDDNGANQPGNGMHASLIIGRRRNPKTNACQFLVRNSWGATCKAKPYPVTLPPELLKDPELPYSFQQARAQTNLYSSDWDCEKGNVWIDADALARSVFGVDALTDKLPGSSH